MKTIVTVTQQYEVEYDHPDNLAHVMRVLKTEAAFNSMSGAAMIDSKAHGYHAKRLPAQLVVEIGEKERATKPSEAQQLGSDLWSGVKP